MKKKKNGWKNSVEPLKTQDFVYELFILKQISLPFP